MRNALLAVDLQADFVAGGSLPVPNGMPVCAMIARHIRHFKTEYQFVVASRDYHENPSDHFSATPDYAATWPPHCVIGTPGELDVSLRAIGGSWTVEFLQGLNLDAAFISGFGMTMDGQLTTTKRLIVDVLQQVCRRSSAVYVLLDSSKLGRKGLLDILNVHDVTGVVTDSGLSGEQVRHLKSRGIQATVAV